MFQSVQQEALWHQRCYQWSPAAPKKLKCDWRKYINKKRWPKWWNYTSWRWVAIKYLYYARYIRLLVSIMLKTLCVAEQSTNLLLDNWTEWRTKCLLLWKLIMCVCVHVLRSDEKLTSTLASWADKHVLNMWLINWWKVIGIDPKIKCRTIADLTMTPSLLPVFDPIDLLIQIRRTRVHLFLTLYTEFTFWKVFSDW